jgi:hypothetical protein
MFIIGFYVRFFPPVTGANIPPFGYLALACIFLFAAFFQFGWGPCCWFVFISFLFSSTQVDR